ncbi:TetR/AcrR family transcriptional regulator [Streptomyces sp. ACA25]|uniref:TetR/AcrR family transcriptional regulator n=1 Tax=Streptomyces sp. ACA25 TaxID=3022596 RepID=UPI00230719FA|nr:TetR/AcrR family transcriptional regulator [Streptomyces sp. ACA25]MDB1086056.1 TetR/AcrR family transcriptional regulator [Streptomyces sp. ACA25]
MPLPRFDRLPVERQELILGVARRHFAEHGSEAASYNKIIEAAGISKTAAYHYFDGREDLLTAVLGGVLGRLLRALGPWVPARDEAEFWSRLEAGAGALVAHLHTHPDDLALADAALGQADDGPWRDWFAALVTDGQRLGVIRTDVDHGLLVTVTAAVVRAADSWALARMRTGAAPPAAPATTSPIAAAEQEESAQQLWSLLRSMWSAPGAAGRDGKDRADAR